MVLGCWPLGAGYSTVHVSTHVPVPGWFHDVCEEIRRMTVRVIRARVELHVASLLEWNQTTRPAGQHVRRGTAASE